MSTNDNPEALQHSLFWLESALNCPAFEWDADQREAAGLALSAARAALAQQAATPTLTLTLTEAQIERARLETTDHYALGKLAAFAFAEKLVAASRQAATPAPAEPTRSQKLTAAGITRRPTWRSLPGALDSDIDAAPPATPAAQPADGWIAVADRLPGECKPILAWCSSWHSDADQPFLAYRNDAGFWDTRRGKLMIGVTHWMPAPEGPR